MSLTSLPLSVAPERQHLLNADFVIESASKKVLSTFFYVGAKTSSIQYFTAFFKAGSYAENFDIAIKHIFTLQEAGAKLPDAILIDIPYNKQKFEAFSFVLKSSNDLAQIPVVYNDVHLDTDLVYELVKRDLIDEATNLSSWETNFSNKIKFLKNLKQHTGKPLSANSAHHSQSNGKLLLNTVLKRVFDVCVSFTLLILLSPLFLIIAFSIALESKGPVFYNSLRAGRGFRIFRFYKFRTMEVGADTKVDQLSHLNQYSDKENGVRFLKICNDPRVTKVGQFLRNTSLDELPQLLNVLFGDMSLVGNRPLPIYEAATLTTDDAVERFMAPAGITGLWQVEKRSNLQMSAEERIELDIKYARNHSFTYDMFILAKTPGALFQKANV